MTITTAMAIAKIFTTFLMIFHNLSFLYDKNFNPEEPFCKSLYESLCEANVTLQKHRAVIKYQKGENYGIYTFTCSY